MKNFFLFISALFFVYSSFGQTTGGDGGNTNGTTSPQAPPTYQNPYGTNPYQTNPFSNGNQNQNIFQNQQQTTPPQNDKTNPDGTKTDNLNGTIKDLNATNSANLDENQKQILREKYKDDPDYLKYLGLDEDAIIEDSKDGEKSVDVNLKQVYGASYLSGIAGNASDQTPTTVPSDYRLGQGDEVVVSIWGASEYQNSFTISRDGSIFPERIGKIYLQGLSFENAQNIIKARFQSVIPKGSYLDVAMGKVRTIRVNVVGEVNNPGQVVMSAFNTPLNVISMAGGITPLANMRDIQIIRNGVVIEHLDLYSFLENGNFGKEVYLKDNDWLSVRLYDKQVDAIGSFRRPMAYQLLEYETLDDLIKLAGGPKYNARESLIRVKTIENEEEKFIDFNGEEYFSSKNKFEFVLRDGDEVFLTDIAQGIVNTVEIKGAVKYPDVYQMGPNMHLFDLIKKAGGLLSSTYLSRAFVYRKDKTEVKLLKVDLSKIEDPTNSNNIVLQSGDQIQILSNRVFDETYFVEIQGLVANPGKQTWRRGLRLKDVLLMAGGLDLEAENGRIEVSNVTDTLTRYSIKGQPINVRTIAIDANLEIDEVSENIIMKAYDKIYVRKKIDIVQQQIVTIVGEVDYPGEYALLGKKERLTSLLLRTGGLNQTAFPEGAKLYRSNVGQVVIDLKAAMRKSGSKYDIILEPGDKIIIPTQNNVVKVTGVVQDPINMNFDHDNNSVKHYIAAAGGFGDRPWRSRITVKYQNGRSANTKNFLFFKFYPKVKPGCVVTVPLRPEGIKVDLKDVLQYGISTSTSLITILLLTRSL